MNNVRTIVGNIFQSPVQTMSYPAYFSYINEAGKVTARSLMDCVAVLFTVLEEQEKQLAQHEQNFQDIEEILQKLVAQRAQSKSTAEVLKSVVAEVERENKIEEKPVESPIFACDVCPKTFTAKVALAGHKRSHKPLPVV